MNGLFSSLSRPNRYVVSVILLNLFSLGIGGILIGAFLPMMRADYGLNYSVSGFLVSAFNIGTIVSGLIAGFLPIFFGRKHSFLVLSLTEAIGFALMLLTRQPAVLFLAFLIAGMARGAGTNYGNSVANELSSDNSSLLNLINAMFALGALVCPFLLLGCNQFGPHGWKLAAVFAAVLGLLSTLSMVPMQLGDAPAQSGSPDFGFLRDRLFWITVALVFSYMCVESSIIGWIVSFFSDTGVTSESFSLLLNGLLWLAILLGRFLCTGLSARMTTARLLLILTLGMIVFFALLLVTHSVPLMILATLGFGLSVSGMYATGLGNGGRVFNRYPVALGFFMMFSGLGGIFFPSIVGTVADLTNIRTGMLLLFLPLALQLIFVLINWNLSKRD
ncbi:MAG: MFS transporter [Eubacteriales bacterium]|nr:MFS transporter [Eubacteriales bacterium]